MNGIDVQQAKRDREFLALTAEHKSRQRQQNRLDLFAAAALQGLLAGGARTYDGVQRTAWTLAQAMLLDEPTQ